MKNLALVILLVGATSLSSQTPTPPDPGKLFQRPPTLSGQTPQFKLHTPAWNLEPHTVIVQPPAIEPHGPIDPGIVKRPPEGLFAQHTALPAMSQRLYAGLDILPVQAASLGTAPTLWPDAKVIPIPIAWPHAKVEPIPTNTNGFTAVPVHSSDAPARK